MHAPLSPPPSHRTERAAPESPHLRQLPYLYSHVDYRTEPTRRQEPGSIAVRALTIIPTYCEIENLQELLPQVLAHPGVDVLVVDDNSPDGTAAFVQAYAAIAPGRVHLLQREAKLGLGTAYVAGFRWALQRNYTHVIQMDADFSHHPATIQRLLQAARTSDLVLGARYVPGGRTVNWPLARKILSRGGSFYARTVLSLPVRDLTGGFKCYRRSVLEAIDLDDIESTGYAFQIELTYRTALLGYRITEIPITFAERQHGTSKMDGSIIKEALFRVWALRFTVPRSLRARGVLTEGENHTMPLSS